MNRAEVEETTFAIKRELAAIRQHDMDTNHKLEEARERSVELSTLLTDVRPSLCPPFPGSGPLILIYFTQIKLFCTISLLESVG